MAKHGNVHYIELDRGIFNGKGDGLSVHSKWLYTVLTELEHRFTGNREDFFFRSTDDLARDSGMSRRQVLISKRVLADAGLIQTWQMHWMNPDAGKKSEKHISAFRITR